MLQYSPSRDGRSGDPMEVIINIPSDVIERTISPNVSTCADRAIGSESSSPSTVTITLPILFLNRIPQFFYCIDQIVSYFCCKSTGTVDGQKRSCCVDQIILILFKIHSKTSNIKKLLLQFVNHRGIFKPQILLLTIYNKQNKLSSLNSKIVRLE